MPSNHLILSRRGDWGELSKSPGLVRTQLLATPYSEPPSLGSLDQNSRTSGYSYFSFFSFSNSLTPSLLLVLIRTLCFISLDFPNMVTFMLHFLDFPNMVTFLTRPLVSPDYKWYWHPCQDQEKTGCTHQFLSVHVWVTSGRLSACSINPPLWIL